MITTSPVSCDFSLIVMYDFSFNWLSSYSFYCIVLLVVMWESKSLSLYVESGHWNRISSFFNFSPSLFLTLSPSLVFLSLLCRTEDSQDIQLLDEDGHVHVYVLWGGLQRVWRVSRRLLRLLCVSLPLHALPKWRLPSGHDPSFSFGFTLVVGMGWMTYIFRTFLLFVFCFLKREENRDERRISILLNKWQQRIMYGCL